MKKSFYIIICVIVPVVSEASGPDFNYISQENVLNFTESHSVDENNFAIEIINESGLIDPSEGGIMARGSSYDRNAEGNVEFYLIVAEIQNTSAAVSIIVVFLILASISRYIELFDLIPVSACKGHE